MISFEELDKRIHRQYPAVLKAYVTNEAVFPLYIRANKTPEADFAKKHQLLQALYLHSSHHKPYGYHIETARVKTRLHGFQDEPVAFYFDSLSQYLGYIQKANEFEAFVQDVQLLTQQYNALQPWIVNHPEEVIAYRGKWLLLLQLVDYFLAHPMPGLFLREIPLPGAGTKFAEQHKSILHTLLNVLLPAHAVNNAYSGVLQFEKRFGLRTNPPRLRLRWLDKNLAKRYTGGLTDIEAPVEALAAMTWQVKTVLVVENKTNLLNAELLLTLPAMQGAIAFLGSGRAASLLQHLHWLQDARILYWGDIDAEGFEILDHFLGHFPATEALCMNMDTLLAHRNDWVHRKPVEPRQLAHLSEDSMAAYAYVIQHQLRLEQEYIRHEWLLQQLLRHGR